MKVECTLPIFSSVMVIEPISKCACIINAYFQDLYEIAYAYGSLCKCWLYTVHPRNVSPITLLSQIFQVPLSLLLRKMIVLLILDIVLNTPHNEPGQSNCEEKSDILRIGMNI